MVGYKKKANDYSFPHESASFRSGLRGKGDLLRVFGGSDGMLRAAKGV